jgi:hypothetical protein
LARKSDDEKRQHATQEPSARLRTLGEFIVR